MIDPFTAFAMAQGAVKGIKAAIALGKDINGLIGEFSKFYSHADEVHIASTKMKMDNIGKTDAQISAESLQIAMASKALRDYERELKDILFYTGNAPVWEEMMSERVRLTKERNAAEKAIVDKKQKDKEIMYDTIMNLLLFVGSIAAAAPIIWLTWYVIDNRGF